MAKYTKNYNLEKQQNNEYISIDGLNNNFDKIDKVLGNTGKFESAGGTATAIILSDVILEDGAGKTFKVTSGNGGASTTINGKKLYKPGTITAPTLIAGKAVTIWYDEAGDCFFIKASAEGNATADHVLAGKTFSNDNDTGLLGNIQVLTGIRTPSGIAKWADGALAVYPEKGYQKGGAGDGEIKVTTDKLQSAEPALISSNIKSGVSIYGVAGSMATPGFYNFPLSIQESQPTAVRNGHIWVKSSATFSKIQIVDAFTAGVADGTLMFVVGDTALRKESISHSIKTTDSKSVTVSTTEVDDSSADWLVSNMSGDVVANIMLRRPMVYSKLNGILDVETAYMWDGGSWQLISQKGSYLAVTGGYYNGTLKLYNVVGDNYVLNFDEGAGVMPNSYHEKFSDDGRYMYSTTGSGANVVPRILKRVGDVFSDYFILPKSQVINSKTCNSSRIGSISGDGSTLAIQYSYDDDINYICTFENNGNGFTLANTIGPSKGFYSVDLNYSGSVIAVSRYNSAGNTGAFIVYFKNTDGSYGLTTVIGESFRPNVCKFSRDYTKIIVPVYYTGSNKMYLNIYTYNEQAKTVTAFRSVQLMQNGGSTIHMSQITSSRNGLVFLGDTTGSTDYGVPYQRYTETFIYDYNKNIMYNLSGLDVMQDGSPIVDLNSDGTRLARGSLRETSYYKGVSIFSLSLNDTTRVATFTLLKKLLDGTRGMFTSVRYFP